MSSKEGGKETVEAECHNDRYVYNDIHDDILLHIYYIFVLHIRARTNRAH